MKGFIWLALLLAIAGGAVASSVAGDTANATNRTFTYDSHSFYLNGESFQILGGQIDPQRVPRAYWADRLQKAKALGLNTIFSYIYWHYFEPVSGQWDFTGNNDLAAWYEEVQKAGLQAVLRAGPYVCGERDWGGFPAWLSTVPGMVVRANNGPFLSAVTNWAGNVSAQVAPYMLRNGGPILMVQVENEYGNYYGTYAKDHTYTSKLAAIMRAAFGGMLYTTDASTSGIVSGAIPGVLSAIDGDPKTGLAIRTQYVTDNSSLGPLLDGEFYSRWYTYWGPRSSFQTYEGDNSGAAAQAANMEYILSSSFSFSLYMFHGGTNFAYGNGAVSLGSGLQPFIPSYDYGAPIDETGRPATIFNNFLAVIQKHVPAGSIPSLPSTPPMMAVPDYTLTPALGLFDQLPSNSTRSSSPQNMEALGQSFGYILYEYISTAAVSGKVQPGPGVPRDRVIVYVNGQKQGVIDAIYATPNTVNITLRKGDKLWLLVENLGRVDFNPLILDQRKGILGEVTIGGTNITGWNHYPFPLDVPPSGVSKGAVASVQPNGPPVFYRGSFTTNLTGMAADTFLQLPGGTKGVVWVNGFNLGRYWVVGPQQELYVPGCYLNAGSPNEVIILELEPGNSTRVARGVSKRTWANHPDPDCNSCK